jgi:hypothetical protein
MWGRSHACSKILFEYGDFSLTFVQNNTTRIGLEKG